MKTLNFLIITILIIIAANPAQTVCADDKPEHIIIGLDADMSSGSARSGEAIRRGAILAIEEINNNGGVLGKPLKLVVRDHRGNPARGIDNMEAFSKMKNMVAVMGGLHTPVAMTELKTIHKQKIIYLCPWAAGTPVIANGFSPNYAFRVSVRDEYAGGFLIKKAIEKGYKRPALLLEQTGWGISNNKAMSNAISSLGLETAKVLWFNWGARDLTEQIKSAKAAGADVIMLVANAPEGAACIDSMARLPENARLPIYSHWGITGGNFYQKVKKSLLKVDLVFLQTYSFLDPPYPDRAKKLFSAYGKKFPEVRSAKEIFSPVGTAHSYDLVHLIALAVKNAGSTSRPKIRDALEQIKTYKGLVKTYNPPFSPDRHDALNEKDFRIARYDADGHIVPDD